MEQKEMLALLKSQMHMTYAERNEIAVHMNALSERLHQQEAEIEKLVQERGTMKASSPTMEWISVEERLPKEKDVVLASTMDKDICFALWGDDGNSYNSNGFLELNITHWMPLPEPPKQMEPTFKEVFLKKFPFAAIDEYGYPCVALCEIYGYAKTDTCMQDYGSCWGMCWDQPYFEPEEEGEADA